MKSLMCFLSCLAIFLVAGCDGDGDGDAMVVAPSTGDGDGDGDGTETATQIVLASGTTTAQDGVATMVATDLMVPGPGTLTGTVMWSAPPAELVAVFKHGGPTNYGWVQGPSTLISSTHVSAAGSGWTFGVSNSSGPDVIIAYQITFTPD